VTGVKIFCNKTDPGVAACRFLQLSLNESSIRSSETPSVLQMIAYNPAGRVLTWRFVRSHWSVLYNRLVTVSVHPVA